MTKEKAADAIRNLATDPDNVSEFMKMEAGPTSINLPNAAGTDGAKEIATGTTKNLAYDTSEHEIRPHVNEQAHHKPESVFRGTVNDNGAPKSRSQVLSGDGAIAPVEILSHSESAQSKQLKP